jgi:LCP family protein required for cell wall assembly
VKSTRAIRIITSLSVAIVLVSSISSFGLGQVSSSIARIDVFNSLDDRPEKTSKAENYLLVGSDTREGLTKEQIRALRVGSTATAAGGRSDTMLLIHLSKARDRAYIISLPRDSLVTIPEHVSSSDKTTMVSARLGKLNSAFSFGGAPLLIETIEQATSIKIDHYVEVSFAGFAGIVDALGGIDVCTKVDIDDPKSHLVLSAGVHTLDGIEALKYVRTRDFDGRGDIGRMQRQQQFMSAVLRKATSSGTLLNPFKLKNFVNASLASVKLDAGLAPDDLLTLAKQMKNLSSGNVRTLTVPLSNPNARVDGVGSVVIWDEVLGADLWTRVRDDLELVDEVTPTPEAKASTKASASASAKPTPVIVDKFKTRTADENPCGEIK